MNEPNEATVFEALCAKIHDEFDRLRLPDDIVHAAKAAAIEAATPKRVCSKCRFLGPDMDHGIHYCENSDSPYFNHWRAMNQPDHACEHWESSVVGVAVGQEHLLHVDGETTPVMCLIEKIDLAGVTVRTKDGRRRTFAVSDFLASKSRESKE